MPNRFHALALLGLVACGHTASPSARSQPVVTGGAGGAAAAPSTAPATRTLTADEKLTTASGAILPAAAGWSVATYPDRIELRSPEGDLTWNHVEVTAPDRDAAVAAAWHRVDPSFALAVAEAHDIPTDGGWDSIAQVMYAVPALAKRLVLAVVRHSGSTWYVELVDGSEAGLDRRGAQLMAGIQGLAVTGVAGESFAGKAARTDIDFAARLDELVPEAMAAAGVPGAAIAIVQGGKVVMSRGWDVRTLGKAAKVTSRTRFMVGSVGKSLTTMLMARLVDRGTVTWQTPVTQLLPDFALADPDVTRALTLRDTVCACTGMPRSDSALIFDGEATAEQRVAALAGARPTTKLGETFQYSNEMVAVGGFAVARAYAGKGGLAAAYAKAMRELVFAPFGMRRTTLDLGAAARDDYASPHPRDLAGAPVAQPAKVEAWTASIAPAGAVWSTVDDMARVLLVELGDGVLAGERVVSVDALHARRTPVVAITSEQAYGLGLVVDRRDGLEAVWHNGGTLGFSSLFWFVPAQGIGAVVLTNAGDADAFTQAIRRRLVELWFDGAERAATDLAAELGTARAARAQLAARATEADPAWARDLVGTWSAPGLGTMTLRRDRGAVVFDTGQWAVALAGGATADGTHELISTTAPLAGFELLVRGTGAAATLVATGTGQDLVELTRVDIDSRRR